MKKLLQLYYEKFVSKPLSKDKIKTFKFHIRFFFSDDTDSFDDSYSLSLRLLNLGITDFKFREYEDCFLIIITLIRPGLLIGKGGRTIEELQKALTTIYNKNVKIKIIESNLWN